MNGESLWSRLAGLALIVEGCEYDRLHAMFAYEFERVTTHVRLVGAGTDGLGEDVSVFRGRHRAARDSAIEVGQCTFAHAVIECLFCERVRKHVTLGLHIFRAYSMSRLRSRN